MKNITLTIDKNKHSVYAVINFYNDDKSLKNSLKVPASLVKSAPFSRNDLISFFQSCNQSNSWLEQIDTICALHENKNKFLLIIQSSTPEIYNVCKILTQDELTDFQNELQALEQKLLLEPIRFAIHKDFSTQKLFLTAPYSAIDKLEVSKTIMPYNVPKLLMNKYKGVIANQVNQPSINQAGDEIVNRWQIEFTVDEINSLIK